MTGILRVDTIQNSNTSTIITQTNSTTITIGTSGQTVALAAGSSQTGFGRSGSVNWDTTAKTANFTAVSGNGYFVDTNTTAITVTLPATPAAGDIVAIADYANTAATNNITVGRNSSPIDGEAIDAKIKINGQVYTLVYVDATEGWKTVGQTFNQISTAEFVAATGGTITTCGNFKIHTFTGPGTFTVTNAGNPAGSAVVDYMVVAGGGGGANSNEAVGGGGAGGFRESVPSPAAWTASPLANPGGALPVSVQGYPITVGAGGAGGAAGCSVNPGLAGANSIFSSITSAGGGGGGSFKSAGLNGGSGGGGGARNNTPGGTGNTPPTSPSQGNNGGRSKIPDAPADDASGGGGGATAVGGNGEESPRAGGNGGAGAGTGINPSPSVGTPGPSGPLRYFAGGGGGSAQCGTQGTGGVGGGGNATGTSAGNAGTTNTGGGAGAGAGCSAAGKSGGSGIVIIRYKFQ